MSSRSAGLVGLQVPRVALEPAADWSHADDAAFLSSSYGLTPDEWQFGVLSSWLAARRDGRWAATTCGLAVPRQNGKNGVLEVRELYGMVALGEKFLHTAHEVKTARKAFLRLKSFFENTRKYPELAALATEIRKTNGQEAIVLENGGSVEFVARSKGSGRGFTVDVLVLDEAQELGDEALEALTPTISAAPSGNPQTIFTGTPPAPSMNGEVWTRTRAAALSRSTARLAWHEWSLTGEVDLDDRAGWAATNPALGLRLNIEVLEDERAKFTPEGFARERLGMWDDEASLHIIPPTAWRAAADGSADPARPSGPVAFAVHSRFDRSATAIVACGQRPDESVLVEVVESRPGVTWAVQRLTDLARTYPTCAVVVDPRSAAGSLITDLEAAGMEVVTMTSMDVAQAFGMFHDAVVSGSLRHIDQPELNAAVSSASRRPIGEAWTWNGRSDTDVKTLVAATNALWGWTTRHGTLALQIF